MFKKWANQLVAEPDAAVVTAAETTAARAREAAAEFVDAFMGQP